MIVKAVLSCLRDSANASSTDKSLSTCGSQQSQIYRRQTPDISNTAWRHHTDGNFDGRDFSPAQILPTYPHLVVSLPMYLVGKIWTSIFYVHDADTADHEYNTAAMLCFLFASQQASVIIESVIVLGL